MKGSPIISTLLAAIVMLCTYLVMHSSLSNKGNSEPDQPNSSRASSSANVDDNLTSAYIEAHFSTPPSSFAIYHPVSNKKIIQVDKLSDNEWSDEIQIPQGNSVELNVVATWKETDKDSQHFVQLILSPNEKDDASATLRSLSDIDTIATFNWAP